MIVEDNQEILTNLELILKFNGYEVWKASDGINALKCLSDQKTPPNLILSDIMMPRMNGYDLLQKLSENPDWNHIPFIFVSAKSSPEDVRFGKKLGVDDYITKPFEEEDLLASIEGKLSREQRKKVDGRSIGKELLSKLKIDPTISISEEDKDRTNLIVVFWDESYGPKIEACYPSDVNLGFSLDEVGVQLFQATVSIYGQQDHFQAQGVLLKIVNISRDGYLYFDTIEDVSVRGNQRQFMLTFIAPSINYLESLRIEEILSELALRVKNNKEWVIKNYWQRITEILIFPKEIYSKFT